MGQGLSVTGGATKMAIQIIDYLENDQKVAVLRERLPRLHTEVHNKSVEAKAASTFRGQRNIVNEHQKIKEKYTPQSFEDLVQDLKCQGGAVVEVQKVCEVGKKEILQEDLATSFSMTKRDCGIKEIEGKVNSSIRFIISKYSVKAVKEEDITVLWESNRLLHIDYIFWQHVDAICGYAIVKHVDDNTRPKTKTFSYVISSGGVGGGGGGDVATGSRSRGTEDNGDDSGLATSGSADIGGGIGVTPEAGSLVLFIATADVNDSVSALLGSDQKHSSTPNVAHSVGLREVSKSQHSGSVLTAGRSGKPYSTRDGSDKKEFSEVDDPKQDVAHSVGLRGVSKSQHSGRLLTAGRSGKTYSTRDGSDKKEFSEVDDPKQDFHSVGLRGASKSQHSGSVLTAGRSGKPHSTRDRSDRKEFSEVNDPKKGAFHSVQLREVSKSQHSGSVLTAGRSGKPHSTRDRSDKKECSEVDDPKQVAFHSVGLRGVSKSQHSGSVLTAGRSGKPHSTRDRSDKKEFSEVDDPKQGAFHSVGLREVSKSQHSGSVLTAGRSGKSHSTRDAFDNEKVSEVDDLKQGNQGSPILYSYKEDSSTNTSGSQQHTSTPLSVSIKRASLDPVYWCDVLYTQLGVQSLDGLKHVPGELNLHLLHFARDMNERKWLQKFLLAESEGTDFKQQRKQQRKDLEVRNAQVKEISELVKSVVKTSKDFGQVKNDLYEQFQLPLIFHPKQQMHPEGMYEVKKYCEVISQLLQNTEESHMKVVERASEGLALRGVFLGQKIYDCLYRRGFLLKVPSGVRLKQPSYYQHVKTMVFKSKPEEEKFVATVNNLGYSAAVSGCVGNQGITFDFPSVESYFVQELSSTKTKYATGMSETYRSLMKEYIMPIASCYFSVDQLQLSPEAIVLLMDIEKSMDSRDSSRSKCKEFFMKFGSHAFKGPLHFGGIYRWLLQTSGFKKSEASRVEQLQHEYITSVVDVPIFKEAQGKTSITGICGSQKCQMQWVVSKSGGSEGVFGVPSWKNGLIANSANWSVIDRGTAVVPVWDIITMNHKNDFKKPFTLAIVLQKAWQSMNQSPSSQHMEIFSTEVDDLVKQVKSWKDNPDLSKALLQKVLKAKESALKVSLDPRVWPTLYLSQIPIQMCLKLIAEKCSINVTMVKEVKTVMRRIIDPLDLDSVRKFRPRHFLSIFLYSTEASTVSLSQENIEAFNMYIQYSLNLVEGVKMNQSKSAIAATAATVEICVYITQALSKVVLRLLKHLQKAGQSYEEIFLTALLFPFKFDLKELRFSSMLNTCELKHLYQQIGTRCEEFFQVLKQQLPLKTQAYLLLLGIQMCTQLGVPNHLLQSYIRGVEEKIGNAIFPQIVDLLTIYQSKNYDCEWLVAQLKPLLHESQHHQHLVKRKTECDQYFSKIGLTEFFPQKLSLRNALEIREDTLSSKLKSCSSADKDVKHKRGGQKSTSCIDPKLYPFYILQKVMAFDSSCRTVLVTTSDQDKATAVKFKTRKGMHHPTDGMLALLHCADNFLRQDLLYRLATCQLAVPLLLPDPFIPHKITYLLWSLRSIEKKWYSGTAKEGRLVDYPCPIVSFLRIGKHKKSKSQIMNAVISDSESPQNFFFHYDCHGGRAKQLFVNGLVEVCWSLPSINHSPFDDIITFANLHGDARDFPKQVDFLSKISLMTFVFIDEKSLENSDTIKALNILASPPGGLVLLQVNLMEDEDAFIERLNPLNQKKLTVIDLSNLNAATIKEEICAEIGSKLSEKWNDIGQESTLLHCANVARECKIDVDEDEIHCALGRTLSTTFEKIISEFIQTHGAVNIKDVLVLQADLWHELGMREKEQYRQLGRGNDSPGEYSRKQVEKIKQFRSEQYSHAQKLHPLMEAFLILFQSQFGVVRHYAFQWIRCFLDDLSKETLPPLHYEYKKMKKQFDSINGRDESLENEAKRQEWTKKLEDLNRQIIRASFGFEHLLREVSQIYEAVNSSPSAPNEMKKYASLLPEVAAELMIDGYPLELMDGDAAHVPINWVNSVLTVLSEILHNPRLCVISILGLQSSGKSTLMNTVFGLRFRASAGRCTRGAFMQLVPIHSSLRHVTNCDYFLIVDTEGLRAPELDTLQTHKHDNELATFVIGLAHKTVTNLFGETLGDMDEILQSAVHAFLRMKKVALTSSFHFVHQNVSAEMCKEKGMMGHFKLSAKLDEVTQAAAKEEGLKNQNLRFRDVIDFDSEKGISRFPNLWKGDPPMAPVNPGYSTGAQKFKIHLIECVKEKSHSHCNELNIFQERVSELWDAVMHENFVFSFKNTLEIRAYNTLEREFGQWSWYMKKNMMKWELEARNKLQSCDIRDVENLKRNICRQLLEYVLNIKKDISERSSSFFEKSHEKERIIEWKGSIDIRITVLARQLEAHAASVCQQILTTRKVFANVDKEKNNFRKIILEQVRDLVLKFTEREMTKEQFREIYNEKWTCWILELKETSVVTFDDDPEADMNEALLKFERLVPSTQLMIDRLKMTSLEHWGNKLELDAKEDYIDKDDTIVHYAKKYIHLGLNTAQKLEFIQKLTDGLLTQLGESVRRMETGIYHPSLATEVLRQLFEGIDKMEPNTKVSLAKFYEIDMSLTVAGYGLKIFKRMVASEKRKSDPVAYLEQNVKELFFKLFKSEYNQTAQEVTAATAVCGLLSQSIEDAVYSSLGQAVFHEMMEKITFMYTKDHLKSKVLFDIGNILQKGLNSSMNKKEAFRYCLDYLQNPKGCLRRWTVQYTLEFCQKGTPTPLTKHSNSIIKKLVNIASTAVDGATSECQDQFQISEWLEKFHSIIQRNGALKIYINELQDFQGFRELKDAFRFSEEVKKALEKEQCVIEMMFEQQSANTTIEKMSPRPADLIVEQVIGCNAQCPFCKEPCDRAILNHDAKHKVTLHRPQCLGWYRWSGSNKCCTELVGSDAYFSNSDATMHPYRNYDKIYPNWDIPDDKSFKASRYWKWVVARYTCEIAEKFNMKEDSIDSDSRNLTWDDVKQDLLKKIS